MAIVESGPIHIKLSLEEAVGILIRKAGMEEELKELIRKALIQMMKEGALKEETDG